MQRCSSLTVLLDEKTGVYVCVEERCNSTAVLAFLIGEPECMCVWESFERLH